MKITALAVSNTLGISHAAINPERPIVLVAGDNGAGKSSLYQAIKLALFDELPRVDLKREAMALLRGGAARGSVSVAVQDDTFGGLYNVTLPDRKRTKVIESLLPQLLLEPSRFAAMEPPERMRLLLNLSEVSLGKEAIVKRLEARGIPALVLRELSPLLLLGFEKCAAHARTQAAEHRGAWKAITGETYGSKKAAGWTPPAEEGALPGQPLGYDEAVKKALDLQTEVAKLEMERAGALARNEAARSRYDTAVALRVSDNAAAGKLDALRVRIKDLKPIAESEDRQPVETLACPHCGGVCELEDKRLVKHEKRPAPTYTKKAIAAAKAELRLALEALAAGEEAQKRLAQGLPAEPAPESVLAQETIDERRRMAQDAQDVLRSLQQQHTAYQAAKAAREAHAGLAERAGAEHALVTGWEAAEEALSPTGIPSELMVQAMKPFRDAVRAACASEAVQTWPLPEISDDAAISAWGRPYALLSKSEQYRVDALLAVALAIQTELTIVAMDGADVLAPRQRGNLLAWLWDMTDAKRLEQAWVFATLKARPESSDVIEAHWIADGTTAEVAAAA